MYILGEFGEEQTKILGIFPCLKLGVGGKQLKEKNFKLMGS